tara:strand:- start:93 stop:272 length:180 start_codon:yes stop_codon:yes gene_type:complete
MPVWIIMSKLPSKIMNYLPPILCRNFPTRILETIYMAAMVPITKPMFKTLTPRDLALRG